MIAASACFENASIVATADSFVGCGGRAENPIRNVRVANPDDDCGPVPPPSFVQANASTTAIATPDERMLQHTPLALFGGNEDDQTLGNRFFKDVWRQLRSTA